MVQLFKPGKTDYLNQPMFFGEPVSTARYDQQTFPEFETLTSKQLGFFWKPEEVNLVQDRIDFEGLPEAEKHIFTENLKYQTLLDSIQGRSPNMAFLPIISVPELETWVEVWSAYETIHSRSYTHILRNVVNDPSIILEDITVNSAISKRAELYTKYYEDLINLNNMEGTALVLMNFESEEIYEYERRKALMRCLVAVNALEALAFYVSFVCSFAFMERGLMEGNSKIIKLIAR